MIALLQRVSEARVSVDKQLIGTIAHGLLVLVAVHRDDQEQDIDRLAQRILGYRVFADPDGRMNLNVAQVGGGLLLVPQFTLAADTHKGLRPSLLRQTGRDLSRTPRKG